MSVPLLFPLALLLGSALPAAPPAPRPPLLAARSGESAADRIARLALDLQRTGSSLDPRRLAELDAALAELDQALERGSVEVESAGPAALDALGGFLARQHAGLDPGWSASNERWARERAEAVVRRRIAPSRAWLARGVLPMPRVHPPERRAAAAWALASDLSQEARLALFTATRDPARLVRDTAVAGLSGRPGEDVLGLFLRLLEEAEGGRLELRKSPLEKHLGSASIDPASALLEKLLSYVRAQVAGEDWRRASRALAVGRCLPQRSAAPMWIEALAVWRTREAAGLPARRIVSELVGELERLSGRRLGDDPTRWRKWWSAVQGGEIALSGPGEDSAAFTRAAFFGLRIRSDRLVFVIDRSGSMEAPFGPRTGATSRSGRNRLGEAVAQMSTCLEQLGPAARFDVVLFSDGARVWRGRLEPATPKNVAAAASWALAAGASGGTQLRAGVEGALRLDARGLPRLDETLPDTVLVLCDGATAEGPTWVRPFLARANDEARVRFCAVSIGGAGDGSLQALCEESGGDFVRVDG